MKLFVTLIISLLSFTAFAAYPFEKYPAPKYTLYTPQGKHIVTDATYKTTFSYTDNKGVAVKIIFGGMDEEHDTMGIRIYRNSKLVQQIEDSARFSPFFNPTKIYVGDLNNDGLQDIKMMIPNISGCGLAGDIVTKIYFIQKPGGTYSKYMFSDFSDHMERDFDGDGKFEIIGRDHDYYQEHSYWVFDLYSFDKGHLVNVSRKYNYPIMIQHLYKTNHVVTNKISAAKMREFSRSLPEYLSEEL